MYPCFSCWPSARCCPCRWKGNWSTKNWSCFSSESCSSSHFLWVQHSPAANHTRSQTKQVQCEPLHSKNEDTTCRSRTVQTTCWVFNHICKFSIECHSLKLPADLPSATQHYVDFDQRDEIDSANKVRSCMQQQWNDLLSPGRKVKVKVFLCYMYL